MEKVNLEQVFDTLNEQRKKLSRCLGKENNTYQQILSKSETFSFWQKWKMLSYLKPMQELLSPNEYKKLWSLPKMRSLAKIMQNILFEMKHDLLVPLDADCYYIKEADFEDYAMYGKKVKLDFVLLPYGQEVQVYEFVVSGVFLKSLCQPNAEDKAFLHSVDVEFIAGFCRNKCFVVRIVPDIYSNAEINKELKKRSNYGLVFSAVQQQHFQFMQARMLELRKRLTLWMEYLHKTLLPGQLGQIGLIDMIEYYPEIKMIQWRDIFRLLLENKHVFSQSLWRKLSSIDFYKYVFSGAKMILQKFYGTAGLPKIYLIFIL